MTAGDEVQANAYRTVIAQKIERGSVPRRTRIVVYGGPDRDAGVVVIGCDVCVMWCDRVLA